MLAVLKAVSLMIMRDGSRKNIMGKGIRKLKEVDEREGTVNKT